jgi:hypothetical protein
MGPVFTRQGREPVPGQQLGMSGYDCKKSFGFQFVFAKILNSPVLQLCLIGSDEEEAQLPEVASI